MNPWILLECIFLGGLVVSNLIAAKMISFLGLVFTAGALTYPITFLATDIVSEIKGKKAAHNLVWKGFYVSIVVVILLRILLLVPEAKISFMQESMSLVFCSLLRMVLASMTAYLVSQHLDVIMFHFWRKQTKGKHLWLRNNASTVVSQFIDTLVFVTIAFAGQIQFRFFISMIIGQYLLKALFALIDTPLCYLGVSWLKKYGR